jgi:voltage-gated potassium channel
MKLGDGHKYWGSGVVYHVVLAVLLLLMLLQPIADVGGGLFVRLTFAALLVTSMATVASRRGLFVIGLILGVPALALLFVPGRVPIAASGSLSVATLLFICVVLLSRIFSRPVVTSATVSAALVVYVMLGIVWAQVYRLVEYFHPGSFRGIAESGLPEMQRDLFYYSYVTLTTLGYGDMSPVSPVARSLAITEAIVGQLYLVVLVAGLVGMHLSHRRGRTDGSGSP